AIYENMLDEDADEIKEKVEQEIQNEGLVIVNKYGVAIMALNDCSGEID
ncbi:MAG: hypothetical protein EZS28_047213, partial [Streblomastix strix]